MAFILRRFRVWKLQQQLSCCRHHTSSNSCRYTNSQLCCHHHTNSNSCRDTSFHTCTYIQHLTITYTQSTQAKVL